MAKVLDRAIPIPESGCWLWEGQNKGGTSNYGLVHINGKRTTAHRQSWIEANGPIPAGLHVLHKCDIPLCVNPNHLYLGSHADNMGDYHSRKGNRGERNGQSKLSADQVVEIRRLLAKGRSGYSIAKEYGVNEQTIYDIAHNKAWRSVA